MTKHTIKEIKQALEQRKDTYKELGAALSEEANLARAESHSARSFLEGKIASLVAQQLPDLNAPALGTYDTIARDHNHPQTPGLLRDRLLEKTAAAKAEQAALEAKHGTAATLAARQTELTAQLAAGAITRSDLRNELTDNNQTLRMADKLNDLLERLDAPQITPDTLHQYARPQGWLAAAWRYMTDKPYREARPVLDGYAKEGIDLAAALQARTASKAALATAEGQHQTLSAQAALTDQAAVDLAKASAAQMTDREILNEVRTAVTGMVLSDPAIFHRVDAAFPGAVDGQMKAMHTRMELFGTLANNIGRQKGDMEGISSALDKPLKDLKKAVSNGNGSKKVEFDLEGKTAKLDKHQLVMSQRVHAARDLRETSHSTTATSYNSSNDSTNWLLWYMIMTNNNDAAAHTHQQQQAAENSYFRAELMGVTPENASQHGLDGKSLSIPADVAADLGYSNGTTSSDFNSLGDVDAGGSSKGADLATGAFTGAAFAEFNDLSKGMDLGSNKLDLGSLSSDLSSLSSDLSSSTGSSSWGSTDSGSSWSSSSGSYDSGSSYSSSSYDSGSSYSSSSSFD